MDVLDPDGLDAWMQVHAQADEPDLAGAALVAVWEIAVRDLVVELTKPAGSAGSEGRP